MGRRGRGGSPGQGQELQVAKFSKFSQCSCVRLCTTNHVSGHAGTAWGAWFRLAKVVRKWVTVQACSHWECSVCSLQNVYKWLNKYNNNTFCIKTYCNGQKYLCLQKTQHALNQIIWTKGCLLSSYTSLISFYISFIEPSGVTHNNLVTTFLSHVQDSATGHRNMTQYI